MNELDQMITAQVNALHDDDWHVRETAMQHLKQIGEPAFSAIARRMYDSRDHVRRTAASLLDQMGWEWETRDELILYAYASQSWDRLVEIGIDALPMLEIALDDENFYVRTSAVLALGEVGDDEVLYYLAGAIVNDPNAYVRSAAARSLQRFGRKAITALARALHDEDKGVRRTAACALVEIGEPAVRVLVQALVECDWYYRREIAQALTEMGKIAIPALVPLLQHFEAAHDAAQILRALDVDPAAYGYSEDEARSGAN